jgi:hypothetical protein
LKLPIDTEKVLVFRGKDDDIGIPSDDLETVIVRCPKTSELFKVTVRKEDLQ